MWQEDRGALGALGIMEVRAEGFWTLPPHPADQTEGKDGVRFTSRSPEQDSMNICTHGGPTPSFHNRPRGTARPGLALGQAPKGTVVQPGPVHQALNHSLVLSFGPTAPKVNTWLCILHRASGRRVCPHLAGHVLGPTLSLLSAGVEIRNRHRPVAAWLDNAPYQQSDRRGVKRGKCWLPGNLLSGYAAACQRHL